MPRSLGVLESSQFVLGEEVAAFEQRVRRLLRRQARASPSTTGTSALHLALLAAGVGPGDEVITMPFTFVATVVGDLLHRRDAGVRRHRSALASRWIRRSSRRRSRRGRRRSCRSTCTARWRTWTPILAIANRHGIPVIEDACQAHGAEYNGQPAGSLGDVGLLQLLSRQEPRRLRRRRHRRHQRRRARRSRSACCATGARRSDTTTC